MHHLRCFFQYITRLIIQMGYSQMYLRSTGIINNHKNYILCIMLLIEIYR